MSVPSTALFGELVPMVDVYNLGRTYKNEQTRI